MKKKNVEQIVKGQATVNFNMYPDCYPIENGLATNEASENAQDLGREYFENRADWEIEQEEALGVTEIDYVEWCMEALASWIHEA